MSNQKDFATIKEMANKKLLNQEEKKVLSKLYEEKIDKRKAEIRTKQQAEYEQAEIKTLASIKAKAVVKKAVADIDKAEKMISQAEKTLKQNGVGYHKNYGDEKKTIKLSINSKYIEDERYELAEARELKAIQDKHLEKLSKIEELKTEIKLALYLPSMTRVDIDQILEAELAKL